MPDTPTPTGELRSHDDHHDLVLARAIEAPIDDVWASITESDRTEKWFARWTGEGRPGGTITYVMPLEEGAPEGEMTIVACETPSRLEVRSGGEYAWHLEARLAEADGVTTIELVHHLDDVEGIGSIGPGWEYYLDALIASRDGTTMPDFDDYYPAQEAYFDALR